MDITERLDQLADAVTKANWSEFSMRVPVEQDRDADWVLSNAAKLIRTQRTRIAALEAENNTLTEWKKAAIWQSAENEKVFNAKTKYIAKLKAELTAAKETISHLCDVI